MGREATVQARVGENAAEVKVLLESAELILRGPIRRRFPRERLCDVRVEGDALVFACDGETVSLHLGVAAARAWQKAIATPPPDLRSKLGLTGGARALRVGAIADAALEAALAGVSIDDIDAADMVIACVASASDLAAELAVHAARPSLHLWVAYPKGRGVPFGDGDVRTVLRAAGFRDSKTCAVSAQLTATRYRRS